MNWLGPARFPVRRPLMPRWCVIAAAGGFRVAYAQDEAFGRYFPDTLEALEALGADLVEFSPLRDERLPDGVDLAMIGCGYPDHHADLLASNVSMIASLREHVCRGRRIYSEGGGTAYLGRRMIIDGRRLPGAGILPFDAELSPDPTPPAPVTRDLAARLLAGPRRNRRPRLQERPLAFDSERRAVRVPRLFRARSRPREIGFTTITRSAVCFIFILAPCRKSSTRSSALTHRRCRRPSPRGDDRARARESARSRR